MVKNFPIFRSERKKRTISGDSPQISNGLYPKITLSIPFDFKLKVPFFGEMVSTQGLERPLNCRTVHNVPFWVFNIYLLDTVNICYLPNGTFVWERTVPRSWVQPEGRVPYSRPRVLLFLARPAYNLFICSCSDSVQARTLERFCFKIFTCILCRVTARVWVNGLFSTVASLCCLPNKMTSLIMPRNEGLWQKKIQEKKHLK